MLVDGPRKSVQPHGPRIKTLSIGRICIYVFLISNSLFFLFPIYVMVVTSIKTMDDIRMGDIFSFPVHHTFAPWIKAWSEACTGRQCEGISPGFWNSVRIVVPSVVLSIAGGAINGYALSYWRPKGAEILFGILMLGAFIPYQVFIFPLVQVFAKIGLYPSMIAVVTMHTAFGMPLLTLLFRNFYSGLPSELFKAARIDGGSFWNIFFYVFFPMSTPVLIVAVILQATGIWNDFIMGLVFAGRENMPMTVLLNNIVSTTQGEREYNVNMAATILTAMVPLIIYFLSGKWFVRGIADGAVKG